MLSVHARIGEVGDSLGHNAKRRRGTHPTHRAYQGYGDELGFSLVRGEDDGEVWSLIRDQSHAVETIIEVVLREVDLTELGVAPVDTVEQPG